MSNEHGSGIARWAPTHLDDEEDDGVARVVFGRVAPLNDAALGRDPVRGRGRRGGRRQRRRGRREGRRGDGGHGETTAWGSCRCALSNAAEAASKTSDGEPRPRPAGRHERRSLLIPGGMMARRATGPCEALMTPAFAADGFNTAAVPAPARKPSRRRRRLKKSTGSQRELRPQPWRQTLAAPSRLSALDPPTPNQP